MIIRWRNLFLLLQSWHQGITGKDMTPFLLGKIVELTGGESLKANIQLVYNNAKVGARIAKAYSELN